MNVRAVRHRKLKLSALLVALCVVAAACSSSGGTSSGTSAGAPKGGASGASNGGSSAANTPRHGGSVLSLLGQNFNGNYPSGLDPASSTTGSANFSILQAIFGGLFLQRADADGTNSKIVPYQAESGTLSSDGLTFTVKLRKGLVFSDGTPFDAKAVLWNWERDTASQCCAPTAWTLRKKDPFTSPDPLTAVIHLAKPDGAILGTLVTENFNWIVSPTAYKKIGETAFKIKPVGAGPFTVVSDKLSTEVVLTRNPKFFKTGQPYLDKLTFRTIGGDQPAYQAILAGQADDYELMETPALINQAAKNSKMTVTVQPPTEPYAVQMNTKVAPFNNIKAREALYYASDWNAIDKGILDGQYAVVQGIETPGDLFYHKTTPGYRTYDLAKAKQLVSELGGLSFSILLPARNASQQIMTALQSQWQKAGMTVKLMPVELGPLIQNFKGGKWNAALQPMGNWDPGAGTGVYFRFGSTSPFSGVHDTHMDELIEQGKATSDPAKRDVIYQQINKYMSDNAFVTFGFGQETAMVAAKGVYGPGLTTKVPGVGGVIWAEAWTDKS